MRVLLTVAYDGTNYHGWQKQENAVTVQGELENALSKLLKENITVRGSSRTDTGVHAKAQRALFEMDLKIPLPALPRALNTFLPDDIVVNNAVEVSENFHPQYSVTDKTYTYKILNDEYPDPMLKNYTAFERRNLDVSKMDRAAAYLIGEYDFSSFCAAGSTALSKVRRIFFASVTKKENIITITLKGNGFLYNMVRIIAGTLVDVGLGKKLPEDIPKIINKKDRSLAGKTMEPNGLTLAEVNYED